MTQGIDNVAKSGRCEDMKIPVSELIVSYMERLGIEIIFVMPGAHILPVYHSLYHSKAGRGRAAVADDLL
jgi:hypothetical protein